MLWLIIIKVEQSCQRGLVVSWHDFLKQELNVDYRRALELFLNEEREKYSIYPPADKVFAALTQTPLKDVKVVILGQDPYHGPGQAMGLSFSVPDGIAPPPSLKNIFKEIETDLKISMNREKGDLTHWANQGVLLLNTLLTVRAGLPLSHQGRGWELFTDHLIDFMLEKGPDMVFLLWGKPAQDKILKKQRQIDPKRHLVLTAAHPSPLSAYRGFLGCKHFSKVNLWLEQKGMKPIDWNLN
jgi:uracil-DNA glycosylase